jgi:cobalt-zinc-cadmium efflux system outer membrane protein
MFTLRTALSGAVCVCLCVGAHASPIAAAPLPLRARIHELWARNPHVQAAEAELLAARARTRAAAQPVYNPSLSLEGENADVDRRTASASLALDLSGKRRARVQEGDAAVHASEAALVLRRRDMAVQWLKGWVSLMLAHRQSALGAERVALMARFDRLALDRLRVGDISAPERDLAALALAEARIEQATIEGQEAAAMGALSAIEGQDGPPLPGLSDALPPAPDSIVPLGVSERPELRQASAEQARLDAGVNVARRARIPDPTVSLTGGRVRSGTRSDAVIGISLSLPLPVLNTGRAEIAAAQADADAAWANRRAAAWQSEAGLRQSATTYRSLRATADALRKAGTDTPGARAALLERLWQAGELDTSDYLVQLKQSLDTTLSVISLESQAWQAWFDYLAAAGRLPEWIDGPAQDATP